MIDLPEVIIQYIFEFNPEHREKFKLTFDEIEAKAAVVKNNIILYDWNKMNDEERPSFTTFLIFSNHIDDFQRYVKALYKCNCCVRHQINKPRHYYDMEWDMENDTDILWGSERRTRCLKECSCPCRHISRQCCIASLPGPEPEVLDYYTD